MGIDTSWRQRIAMFVCSPRRLTLVTPADVTGNSSTQPYHNIRSWLILLCIACIISAITQNTRIPCLGSHSDTINLRLASSRLHTPKASSINAAHYYQHSMLEHLHTSASIVIAQRMDIHPNPGPTALHILKDFTNPEQRSLFNRAQRLKLKLTRYEHHKSNYIYYHNMIPKGLAIKCKPTIESAYNEQFH